MQLKGEERAAPRSAALALGAAHEDQHRLQLETATLRIASGLFRQEVCRLPNGDRATSGQAFRIFQSDFELNPDCEGMAPQRLVVQTFR